YLVWRLNYTEKEEVIQEFFLKFLITFFYYSHLICIKISHLVLDKSWGGGILFTYSLKSKKGD
ncbi:hypothetical protein, partial [Streptobacillus moniliformis]|uniref:hypothetical protein n=1 Tax=Streptobacillus moniliformis TaxID=34105 RepID=UPI001E42D473